MWDVLRRLLGHCSPPAPPQDDPETLSVKGEMRQALAKHDAVHRNLSHKATINAKAAAATADALEILVSEMMSKSEPRQ